MAILYFLRHQKAGILHEEPFTEVPDNQTLEDRVLELAQAHGATHPKTGEPYWTKLVKVDTDKAKDDPERTVTVAGVELVVDATKPPEHPDHIVAKLVPVEAIDARASGHCPIREGEVEVLTCEHGHNDLARCEACAPFVALGIPRVHIPRALKLGLSRVEKMSRAARASLAGEADAGLQVSASGVGHVKNPE